MRIWLVPLEELSDQRVRAQHGEWHWVEGWLARGHRWKGWEKPEYQEAFAEVHDLLLTEYEVRNLKPPTRCELVSFSHTSIAQVPYPRDERELAEQRWQLVCRARGRYQGRGEIPLEYTPLMHQYAQSGCIHGIQPGGTRFNKETGDDLCGTCKRAYRTQGGGWVEV